MMTRARRNGASVHCAASSSPAWCRGWNRGTTDVISVSRHIGPCGLFLWKRVSRSGILLHVATRRSYLVGLDDVDWRNLQHAYGGADDVPDLLLSLAEGDDSAIGELFGNIYHQG